MKDVSDLNESRRTYDYKKDRDKIKEQIKIRRERKRKRVIWERRK